jgi:glutathione S-transferase
MNELVLHHYPSSPFAEKIRLILGFKGATWRSVHIPQIMPKPDVVALTGGYRKTPILQIGADIYCDTALIADVLDKRLPGPSLYDASTAGIARILAQWGDTTLFWAAMAHNFSAKGAMQMFGEQPPEVGKAFADDRAKMRVALPRMAPSDGAGAYRSYLRRLSAILEHHTYLTGSKPGIADFACYHPLWFTRHITSVMAPILDTTPHVLQWMDRMAAIGHGSSSRLTSTEAIAMAAAATPQPLGDLIFQDDHGIPLGTPVMVRSEAFGPEPTEGLLRAATRTYYVLERRDERAGTVHVHLPRIGYGLKALA